MRKIILVWWPSFLVAILAEGVFFTVINPQELYLFGQPVHYSALATYSIGFLGFWAVGAASSLLTCFLHSSGNNPQKLGSGKAAA